MFSSCFGQPVVQGGPLVGEQGEPSDEMWLDVPVWERGGDTWANYILGKGR